jgi:hypothetical protein
MSACTPGPWHTDGASIRPDAQHMVAYADGSLPKIAVVMPLKSSLYAEKKDQHKGCITAGTPEANARLIAAAPDLLEALRSVLHHALYKTGDGGINCRFCDNCMDDLGTGRDMHDAACEVRAVRAAIAKAEGR